MNLKKKFINNIIYAFSAQFVSLAVSILMSLIVPKFLGISDFAFWQLFIFYTNYVNIAQFGILDGIYLTSGGKNYDELDYSLLRSEYYIFGGLQIIVAAIIIGVAFVYVGATLKFFVFVSVAIYLVVYNLSRFLGFVFQAVNNTQWFSISSMIDRITILVLGATAIIAKRLYWQLFVCIYITGITVSLLYTWTKGKSIVFDKNPIILKDAFRALYKNACNGICLMLSNLASTLILGCGRQFIEMYWGLEVFGKVSFALSMTNFFLLFINQVSLVMFPALKKLDVETGKMLYKKVEYGFSILSPIVYIIYIPSAFVLGIWLPQYKDSLVYLMLFMPVCVFDGKMQMLYNTYLKVLRKEKLLFAINVLCVVLSITMCCLSVFAFNNMCVLLISMVCIIAFRSLLSYYSISKTYGVKLEASPIFDMLFALLFIGINIIYDSLLSFVILSVVYIGFLFSQQKKVKYYLKKEGHRK